MISALVTACGFLDDTGYGAGRQRLTWPPGAGLTELRWATICRRPFDRFGRLDCLSKYAVAAVEMLHLPLAADCPAGAEMAIALGTQHGSVEVDGEFIRSTVQPGGASPALFSYTLPSSAVAEIAIRHGITGPNLCVLAGPDSGLLALWEGLCLLDEGQAQACVCVASDACPRGPRFAYAFLIELPQAVGARGGQALAALSIRQDGSADAAPASMRRLYEAVSAAGAAPLSVAAPAALRTSKTLLVSPHGQAARTR